ncbi:MAG: hypothetical protein ACLQIB_44865 [Isosphaeraceae bacterium]
MECYRISMGWLTTKLESGDREWSWAVEQLRPDFDQGDELWHFDEPAPPGINAGAIGIAVVRNGEPIRTIMTAVH